MKKFIILFFLSFNLLGDDKIVIFVEDEVITQKEIDYALKEGIEIEDIINLIIYEKKGEQLALAAPPAMVLERIGEIKERFPESSLFNAALEDKGMDEDLFKKRIEKEITKARLINFLKERIKINEKEIISSFNNWQTEVEIEFLEFKNKADAERVFLELTRDGTPSAKSERLGFFCLPELEEELSKIVSKLDEGEISHPFKIKEKYYIIKVLKKRETETNHLAKIRDELFIENRGKMRQKTPFETREDILNEILMLEEESLKNKKFEEYLKEFLNEAKKSVWMKY